MYLPQAPDSVERTLFYRSDKFKLYLLSAMSVSLLFTGMGLFVWVNDFFPYTLFILITAFYLTISYLIGFMGKEFDPKEHERIWTKHIDKASKQDMDIFLPICGEPREVIENTWKHVKRLRLTHEGLLRIYVLDDGRSDEMELLANQYGFYYIRRESNELKKAGNLRNAFKKTTGEFILILDADFCPQINFLIETLPYFYEDEKLSIVQTPQFFEVNDTMTRVQRGAAAIQELFYRVIQVSRNTFGGSICVGTNAVYRRSHLEPFGGTAAIGYSEDVRTGFQLLRTGYKIKYLPVILAKGICPETWKQFFVQNYRWAMGSISLFLSREFWQAKITKMQRLCYLSGMLYYMSTGLSVLFFFIPSLFILMFKPEFLHWFNLLWAVPSLLLTNVYLRMWQKVQFTWEAVEARHISYYAHLFALIDTITSVKEAWVPTGAKVKSKNFTKFKYLFLIHTVFLLTSVTYLASQRVTDGVNLLNVVPLMGFLLYHLCAIARPLIAVFVDE